MRSAEEAFRAHPHPCPFLKPSLSSPPAGRAGVFLMTEVFAKDLEGVERWGGVECKGRPGLGPWKKSSIIQPEKGPSSTLYFECLSVEKGSPHGYLWAGLGVLRDRDRTLPTVCFPKALDVQATNITADNYHPSFNPVI